MTTVNVVPSICNYREHAVYLQKLYAKFRNPYVVSTASVKARSHTVACLLHAELSLHVSCVQVTE